MPYYQISPINMAFLDEGVIPPEGAIEITQEQFESTVSTRVITPQMAQAALVIAAHAQLDLVTGPRGQLARCQIVGIAFPSAWQTYVQALRAIVNGTDTTSTALPTQPAYIPGT